MKQLLLGILAAVVSGIACSQDYPSRPVTIINPNAPGGIVDIVARAVASGLQTPLKQSVIVVNRAGANGAIGAAAVANAQPDGYTLLLSTPSYVAVPAIDELFGRTPLYSLAQFAPLAQITVDPVIMLAHPSLGAKTITEFIAIAKSKPTAVVLTSSGTYGATHLPWAMVEMASGAKFRHVPTTGGGPAITMTLGGHTNAVASAPGVAYGHVQGGKLFALAQTGSNRIAAFSSTPTLKESGIDVDYALWTALFAPAKTPAPILKVINEALRQMAADSQFKAAIEKGNSVLSYQDGPEFIAAFDREAKRLQATVRFIGKVEEGK
jgi:tripartite-type tricarboxylate transporter receptor subunit TctC